MPFWGEEKKGWGWGGGSGAQISFGMPQHLWVEEQVSGELRGSHAGCPLPEGPKAARRFTGRGGCRIPKPVKFFIYIDKFIYKLILK